MVETYKQKHPNFGKQSTVTVQTSARSRAKRFARSTLTGSLSSARSRPAANCRTSTRTSKCPINVKRYLVPNDLTAYKFSYIIRKRIKMPEKDSLYFFVNGRYVLKGDTLMSEVYDQRKDNDGFLYITYTDETTLGADL